MTEAGPTSGTEDVSAEAEADEAGPSSGAGDTD
jgi:hypothetical protein